MKIIVERQIYKLIRHNRKIKILNFINRLLKIENFNKIDDNLYLGNCIPIKNTNDFIKSLLVRADLIFWTLKINSSREVDFAYDSASRLFLMRERYWENDSENAFIAFIFYNSTCAFLVV